jgi:RimJ/RimL family protein N-acetyltransferase
MTLRLLQAADAAEFQALRLRGLAEAPTAFASSHAEEVGTPLQEISRRLQPRADAAQFGAWFEGRLAGVVGLQREGLHKLAHKAFLWGMYVAPEARGQGLGALLLQAALSHAWAVLAVRQVNLGVHAENTGAIRLYQRLGFECFGVERAALQVDGQLQDEWHMVCVRPAAPAG